MVAMLWLWFDVEKRYLTTGVLWITYWDWLWFDVEKRYLTTTNPKYIGTKKLWFDVEKRYLTTQSQQMPKYQCCGLM